MQSQTIGFVGKPYAMFIEWLLSHGYRVVCLVERGSNYTFPSAISDIFYCDFTNREQFEKDLEQIQTMGICGFVATYENAVVAKAWACEALGLPGLPIKSAELATDKYLMRLQFQQNCPEISPVYAQVRNWEDVELFLSQHSLPLMLKPANLFKSLLVTKNDSIQELHHNFQQTIENLQRIYDKENVRRAPSLLIEEYMEGRSYSVEVFADQAGRVYAISPVDLVMGRDLGVQDNFNYSRTLPSALGESEQKKIMRVAEQGVKALGFRSSPAHVELIWTSNGPKIIEIGARVGGYRPRMYRLANGIDLFQAQVDLAEGKVPELQKKENAFCSVYELFPPKEGYFIGIRNWESVNNLTSKFYAVIKAKAREKTGLSKDGYRAAGVIISATKNRETFLQENSYIQTEVSVEVE